MKFDGKSGRRPSAEARRYIYRCLASTLREDIDNGAGYLWSDDDLDEFDVRRLQKEGAKVLRELLVKAGLESPRKISVNWDRVPGLMLKSHRGTYITASEQNLLQRAYDLDRDKYGVLYRKMKAAETERIRSGG